MQRETVSVPPLPLVAPLVIALVGLLALLRQGPRPRPLPVLAEGAAFLALLLAAAGVAQLLARGPVTTTIPFVAGFPFVDGSILFRLDAVSATMALLVAFVGWIVVRYARSYLDGEAREGAFHGLLLFTLAAVLVVVQAGSLVVLVVSFLAVGVGLRRLLLFYRDRAEAQRAATKFTLVWGAGDVALILGAVMLWYAFSTSDLARITGLAASEGLSPLAGAAAVLLVLAALLKTATFPWHGWLTEVMEAPTPVSALLHAGIINSGGFLLIRLADVVQQSPGAMAVLILVGGLTALFGAMVMLTQGAVKTALAWSTVSQMGFLLLECGLGLWTLALLHIVAHSLYKAHAFLASGTAVAAVNALRKPGPISVPGVAAVARAFGLALVLYAAVAGLFSAVAGAKSPQAIALGTILIFGVAYLVAQGLSDSAPRDLSRSTLATSAAVAVAYFGFHVLADALWGGAVPKAPDPGPLEWALIALAVGSFGTVAVAQALFPHWAHHPAAAGLRVHLANGLYLNAVLDRLIGGLRFARAD